MTLSGGIGWDSETTNQLGYTYYGSDSDWIGLDDGTRDIPTSLAAALASGKPILEGGDFSGADLAAISMDLVTAPTTLLQPNTHIPVNWSVRSEERRVGKERCSKFISRWSPQH